MFETTKLFKIFLTLKQILAQAEKQKRWGVFNNNGIRKMLRDCCENHEENGRSPLPCLTIVFDNDYFWT